MTVNFGLSADQRRLKDAARKFAVDVLRPLAARIAAEQDPLARALLLKPAFEEAVAAGFLKGFVPEPFGGTGGGGVEASILIEEWAVECPDFVISMAGPLIALAPVYEAGTPDQIRRFVAPFLTGEGAPCAAMAFSEPDGSANFDAPAPATGITTRAVRDGSGWVINGRKAWASLLPGWDGGGPDLMTILARTYDGLAMFVAEREHLAGHIVVEEYYDLPGLRGCMTARVELVDVRVPDSNRVGELGQGAALNRNAFLPSGASIGVFAVAAMRSAWNIAYEFARTQTRGGAVPILEHQAVADVLATSKGQIEAVRLLSWRAMDAILSGAPEGLELALHSKVFGSDTAASVLNQLVQVVGVSAYDLNQPIWRHLNDALAYPLIEGSNIGVRRRQLQSLFLTPGFDRLAASGLA